MAEQRFRHDFARLRVHRGQVAEATAVAVGAPAFTLGRHIVARDGARDPETQEGAALLLHELTHAVQQSSFSDRELFGAPLLDSFHPSEQQALAGCASPSSLSHPAIQRGPPKIVVSKQQITVDLTNSQWRQLLIFEPGQKNIVYVLRDTVTGEFLKVGKTTVAKIENRFGEYVTAGNKWSRKLAADVYTLPTLRNSKVEAFEAEIRAGLERAGARLPWDNSRVRGKGRRINRPGQGIPDTKPMTDTQFIDEVEQLRVKHAEPNIPKRRGMSSKEKARLKSADGKVEGESTGTGKRSAGQAAGVREPPAKSATKKSVAKKSAAKKSAAKKSAAKKSAAKKPKAGASVTTKPRTETARTSPQVRANDPGPPRRLSTTETKLPVPHEGASVPTKVETPPTMGGSGTAGGAGRGAFAASRLARAGRFLARAAPGLLLQAAFMILDGPEVEIRKDNFDDLWNSAVGPKLQQSLEQQEDRFAELAEGEPDRSIWASVTVRLVFQAHASSSNLIMTLHDIEFIRMDLSREYLLVEGKKFDAGVGSASKRVTYSVPLSGPEMHDAEKPIRDYRELREGLTSDSDRLRLAIALNLYKIAKEYPFLNAQLVRDMEALSEDDDHKVRRVAAVIVSQITTSQP